MAPTGSSFLSAAVSGAGSATGGEELTKAGSDPGSSSPPFLRSLSSFLCATSTSTSIATSACAGSPTSPRTSGDSVAGSDTSRTDNGDANNAASPPIAGLSTPLPSCPFSRPFCSSRCFFLRIAKSFSDSFTFGGGGGTFGGSGSGAG
ncbi:hypothetical protein OH76DRAFT_1408271 [Lentinus brumalis]|uniref:Uncharacterized protein n=1 Tax=Lentinus brumalis TaxID=2498619 RepID=A0A371CYG7_9APHY|nr:hypothetical protein OH76DRAFT_1408271 [Polyporus brumalis]